MFECQACLRQSLRALVAVHAVPVTPLAPAPARRLLHTTTAPRATQAQASAATTNDDYAAPQLVRRQLSGSSNYDSDPAQMPRKGPVRWVDSSSFERAREARKQAQLPLEKRDRETQQYAQQERKQLAALQSELKYLKDPAKLANHVAYTLKEDEDEKALALVRLSSRALSNTVSWNHLIDWNMRKGKTKAAFEVYNEMKKRGQKPDSYTFLLLLRGLANYAHHPQSLGRALSLYHAMSAPKSPMAPTIMHTNAVLKVCVRANDMDSLWDISSRLPERGPHAADKLTFTTIFNSIRHTALTGGTPNETAEDTARRREQAVVEARNLWAVVVKRWRAGDLLVDEEVVCSMGRVLLVGSRPRDWDDVLSLLQQAMDIPRLVPRLGTAARESAPIPRVRAPNTPADMKNDNSEIPDPHGQPKPGSEFDVFQTNRGEIGTTTDGQKPTIKRSLAHAYARAGSSTLSLVLEACLKMFAKRPALDYWNLMTDPQGSYGLVPDLDNMHMHLRVLRQAHASAEALALLRDDFPAARLALTRKTFHIAMAACARDARNPKVHATAGSMLDLALNSLTEPGARTMLQFLEVAEQGDVRVQLRALERLEPGMVRLRSLLNFGSASDAARGRRAQSPGDKMAWEAEKRRERDDAVELLKRMVAGYDRVLDLAKGRGDEFGLDQETRRLCEERRSKLSAFVFRQVSKQNRAEVRTEGYRTVARSASRSRRLDEGDETVEEYEERTGRGQSE